MPIIRGVIADIGKVSPPDEFKGPVKKVVAAMKKVDMVFVAYAQRISIRKEAAMVEGAIKKAGEQFHTAVDHDGDKAKALEYWNILNCAVPGMPKAVRAVKKGPDTSYVVNYIASQCYKKDPRDKELADAKPFADRLRACYANRKSVTDIKDKAFREGLRYLSGDNRDIAGIIYCFNGANRSFDRAEIVAVAKAFVEYANAKGAVLQQLEKVKKELAN